MRTDAIQPIPDMPRPQMVIEVHGESGDRLGYVVIDRPVSGSAFGPVMMAPDVSLDELAHLARTLTYKWGFLNIPMGGAMAGLIADPHLRGGERTRLLEAFGRSISSLVRQGAYYPGIDLGLTPDDLRTIMSGAGRPLEGQQIDSAFFTGLTVLETIRQVIRFNDLDWRDVRIGLEGFGKVGSALAQQLAQAGARLVALSTSHGGIVAEEGLDVSRLLDLKQEFGGRLVQHYHGATLIAREALYTQPIDLLVPGAHAHVIDRNNVGQVQARWIVPIANAPIAPEAERALIARGVLVAPDFVANCGGVLAVDMRAAGFGTEDVRHTIEGAFAQLVAGILRKAQAEHRPAGQIAQALAWRNHCDLNRAHPPAPASLAGRISRVVRSEGWRGVGRRLARRLVRRWPRFKRWSRSITVEQFVASRLDVTSHHLTLSSE